MRTPRERMFSANSLFCSSVIISVMLSQNTSDVVELKQKGFSFFLSALCLLLQYLHIALNILL
jgi:hypothetical protein